MNPDPAAPAEGITASVVIPKSTVTRPDDPSRYIRTYAKDVAQLTGKQPVPPSGSVDRGSDVAEPKKTRVDFAPPISPVKPGTTVFAQADLSARDGVGSGIDDPKPEIFTTSKEDEEIFAPRTSPLPVSAWPAVPVTPPEPVRTPPIANASTIRVPVAPPAPMPITEVPAPTIPTAENNAIETEQAYRESILARLRAKVQDAKTPVPVTRPVHAQPQQPPEPHREINLLKMQASLTSITHTLEPRESLFTATRPASYQPQSEQRREETVVDAPPMPSVAPSQSVPLVTPVAMPVFPPAAAVVQLPVTETSSPLHTYSSDFADHIDERKATTFSVLAAQQDTGRPRPLPSTGGLSRSRTKIIAAVFVIVLGVGLAGGAFYLYGRGSEVPFVAATPPSLVPFDESAEVSGTGSELLGVIAAKAQQVLLQNNVLLLYVTESTTTTQGTNQIPQPGGALIERMNLNAPDILLRNIDQSSTVGIIHAGDQTEPFFVLRVNSYERTFAGMLAWEPTITADLGALYPAYPQPVVTTAAIPIVQASTSTASSSQQNKANIPIVKAPATPVAPQVPVFAPSFVDKVVSNRNVREYLDAQGRIVLLYGYVDKETLIIARDADAFSALLARIPSGGVK